MKKNSIQQQQAPTGVVVTWGKDLIAEKGGLLAFLRFFEQSMAREDNVWLHKCRTQPKHDIAHVYIIICNQVKYRLFYGGYERGERQIHSGDGISWSSRSVIRWPRLVLAGPVVKAPRKIPYRGFQGFRYVYEPFF